jgi:hypothetical protein
MLPDAACHTRWTDYLTADSCIMAAGKTRSLDGHRLVVRLAFNNEIVQSIVHLHLTQYSMLLEDRNTNATFLDEAAIITWKTATAATDCASQLTLGSYVPRYDTTAVTGWPLGPDGPPTSADFMDFSEPLGNRGALHAFIAERAPHCTKMQVHDRPTSGTVCVQFFHERQHRTELFNLDGMTAPQFGINHPLRLRYRQREPPATQCCSFCGMPGHPQAECPVPAEIRLARDSAMDTSSSPAASNPDAQPGSAGSAQLPPSTANQAGVCRSCYSRDHQSCSLPPEQRRCNLCQAPGHTSFSCPQYRSRWAPLP